MALEAISNWGAGATSALGLGGAGSSLGSGVSFFDIKINEVAPSDVSGMDANQIMDILHNLDVNGVSEAAAAHTALGEKLQQVADKLVQNAQTLSQSWQGTAAQAAMNKFQHMHTQTAQLAAQAKQTGQVLHWTAGVMQQYKNLPAPHGQSATQADEHTGASIGNTVGGAPGAAIGDAAGAIAGAFGIGGGSQAKANAQAQKYLHSLNQHLVAANNALPSQVGQAPSTAPGGPGLGPAQHGGGGAASGGGGVASGPGLSPYSGAGAGAGAGSGAGSAGPSGISKFNAAPLVHGGAGPSASLQGYAPPAGGPSTLPAPGTTVPSGPGGPVGMPSFVPAGPVPNENGLAADEALAEDGALPGADGAAVDGAAADGAAVDGAAADGAAADGVAAEGVPGVSGMGAAGNAAAEDLPATESALGSDSALGTDPAFEADAAVAEGAIGDGEIGAADASAMGAEGEGMLPMAGGAGAGQQDKERRRQAWMDEDADIWGVPRDHVGWVIDRNG